MQVDKLKMELETQQRQKDALEAKASEAEKKIGELNLKLEKVSYLFFGILEIPNFFDGLSFSFFFLYFSVEFGKLSFFSC